MGPPPPRVEPTPRRIRVRVGGREVADSRDALLIVWFGRSRLPTYALPPGDVVADLLTPAAGEDGPFTHGVRTEGGIVPGVARAIDDPEPEVAPARGWWTFAWDDRVTWLEEAHEAEVHARDPRKRVDAVPSDRHVRISVGGVLLADTRRPLAVFETDLPTRWYVPREDLVAGALTPSGSSSRCPYKGTAAYWDARAGDAVLTDIAWAYEEPVVECPRLAGHVAFWNERCDIEVDGVLQERPVTPWS